MKRAPQKSQTKNWKASAALKSRGSPLIWFDPPMNWRGPERWYLRYKLSYRDLAEMMAE